MPEVKPVSGKADGIVLIHGGRCSGRIWSRMTPLLALPGLAVDLPGRNDPSVHPQASFELWAASVVADMDAAGLRRAVLVGHSMGGGTLAAAARLFPERVAGVIYFSAVAPPHGRPFLEGLTEPQQAHMRRSWEAGQISLSAHAEAHEPPTDPDRRFLWDAIVSEALGPFFEPVSLAGLAGKPLGYVKLLRDRSLDPQRQEAFIARLREWGPVAVRSVDSSHMAMALAPRESAEAVNSIVEEFAA